MQSIALKAWQSEALVDLLESDSGRDDEKLLTHMMSEAKVNRTVAEAYLKSYRENPKEGTIGVVVRSVHAARKLRNQREKQTPTAEKPKPPIAAPIPEPTTQPVIHEPVPQPPTSSTEKPKKEPAHGDGIVAAILRLHDAGLSNKEIIDQGYNKSTVYRQVGEYKKRKAAEKAKAKPAA